MENSRLLLAAAILGLALPASTMAANGSNPRPRMSAEYREAIEQAERDYKEANRRCESLGMDERKLCQHDSARARRAAVVEAQPGLRIPPDARPDAVRGGTGLRSPVKESTK